MPTELDDLFSALGRQADAVPLAPAIGAQQRGAQRRRSRAVVAGAAAVLVAVGVGAAVWRGHPGPGPIPAAPAGTVRKMSPVGSPVPVRGAKAEWTQTVIADGRLYAAAETPGVESKVVAIDLDTAKILWESTQFHAFYDYNGPIAVPGALLVTDSATMNEIPVLHVLDPASGTIRWKLPWRTPDEVVVGDGVLVRMVAATGVTDAYDLNTGVQLWSLPAGTDRSAHIVGMQSGDYDEVGNLVGPDITISDDGLVQLTRGGQVVLRDIRTGTERRTVQTGQLNPQVAVAHEGELFTRYQATGSKAYQINLTDLTGASGRSRLLYTTTDRWGAGRFVPCGPHRLCLGGFIDAQNKSTVVAIDTETGKERWTAGLRTQVNGYLYARGSRVLRGDIAETGLYDAKGREVYAGTGEGRWIDERNVLWMDAAKPGYSISVVAAGTGRKVKLGATPDRTGNCSLTSEFLACPVAATDPSRSELRIWRFTR